MRGLRQRLAQVNHRLLADADPARLGPVEIRHQEQSITAEKASANRGVESDRRRPPRAI